MGIGTYGIIKASDVDIDNIDVFYTYSRNRESENNEMFRLNASEVLSELRISDSEQDDELYLDGGDNIIEGMYNLRLSSDVFNQLGIYTIYIKPKSYILKIIECNVLLSLPSVRGVIIDSNDLPEYLSENNSLQGYRIEYYDENKFKIRNLSRYIVSSNKVTPVSENVGNTSQSSIKYRFDDSGSLLFLQLTPSSAVNVKPNQQPFLGKENQIIKITNTYFSPLVIEVEMVENTIESLGNLLMGEQVKDVRSGILTYFDSNREITKQYNLFTIKDSVGNVPIYEVKELRDNIDESQSIDDILDEI